MPTIHFNGKTYNDIAEMPATERQAYEQLLAIFKDENQDGVPDIFQGDVVGNILKAATTTVFADGKQISGLGALTPQQRLKFEIGMAKLKELGIISQVPDLPGSSPVASWEGAEIRPSKPIIPSPSAIQPDRGNSRMLIVLLVLLGLGACGIAAAVVVYLGSGL